MTFSKHLIASSLMLTLMATTGSAVTLQVTIENLAPSQGTHMSPLWVGFHDGTFDIYDPMTAASTALERLAEDGDPAMLGSDLMAGGSGTVEGRLPAMPPVAPGDRFSRTFILDPLSPMSHYFSYAAMVVPSNDAFIANDDPLAHQIFDAAGNFTPLTILVLGSQVRDAGTEVNDEVPANTAFLAQMTPNTGMTEGGVVTMHGGFIPGGNILTAFPNADFTQPGYQIARITVEQIPEPGTWALTVTGVAGLFWMRRRRRGTAKPGF